MIRKKEKTLKREPLHIYSLWTKTHFNSNYLNVRRSFWSSYLFDVDLDGPIVVLIQGFEGTWIKTIEEMTSRLQNNIHHQGDVLNSFLYQKNTLWFKWITRLGLKPLTTHGIQPDEASNVVIKVQVAAFITVSADYHLTQLIVEGEPCRTGTAGKANGCQWPVLPGKWTRPDCMSLLNQGTQHVFKAETSYINGVIHRDAQ